VSNVRNYVQDHKRNVFAVGAPTTDGFDLTGRLAEDFVSIARRYATQPVN
jgi:hypothetical protein